MRLPILYALTYPERIPSELRFLIGDLRHLDFCPPDMSKFPCLGLAYEAAAAGGAKTIALNAADEVAVAAFLDGQIDSRTFLGSSKRQWLQRPPDIWKSIQKVLALDTEARLLAREVAQPPPQGIAHRGHFLDNRKFGVV